VMLWSMFYTYRPNRLGGCYIQLSNSKRFLSALVENVGFSSMVATVTTTSSWANAKLIPWELLR